MRLNIIANPFMLQRQCTGDSQRQQFHTHVTRMVSMIHDEREF
ncbi:hypothetical protein [Caldalkalibacillus salinus]|nr:hypothetical protein [Caldalkalibacillus salinus]